MLEVLGLVAYSFAWGIRRGASSCMALCIPSIIPTLVAEKGGWLGGLKVALFFNAPRILFLTLLGAAIGATGFLVRSSLEALDISSLIWAVGYALAGSLMVAYGAYTFARATDRLEDIAEGKKVDCAEASHPLLTRFVRFSPRTRVGLLLWGAFVSLACIGETVVALEGALVGFAAGSSGFGWEAGAAIGALAFLFFAAGASLPSIVISSVGGRMATMEGREKTMLRVEQAAALVMIVFGALFLISSFFLL